MCGYDTCISVRCNSQLPRLSGILSNKLQGRPDAGPLFRGRYSAESIVRIARSSRRNALPAALRGNASSSSQR